TSALSARMSVVLTESKAIRYFGSTNVVGKDIHYETDQQSFIFHVSGVIKDLPQQSHFKADFLASFHSLEQVMPWYNSWYYPQMQTYLLAKEGSSKADLETQLNLEARKIHPNRIIEGERTYYLQQITDIHLNSNLEQEWEANSSMGTVYLFITIALFMLIIASINFMNLSTAQAATRAKEVGLRKTMGAFKVQLVLQFLGEAIVITAFSFAIGFALAEWVLLGGLNEIIGRHLTLDFIYSNYWLGFTLLSVTVIGICSGLYPAFFLSGFRPVNTLKGVSAQPGRGLGLRSSLVVIQFVTSSVILIFTWIVLDQNSFMVNVDPGFNKDHVVAIHLNDDEAQRKYKVLKDNLIESQSVAAASLCSGIPGKDEFYGFSIKLESEPNEITIKTLGVDEDYLKTYDLQLILGRDFSHSNKADEESAFIINEAAAERFGWTDPVGKDITFIRYTDKKEERPGKVIGLVKDFHFASLHYKVEPLLIYINRHSYFSDYLSVRFNNTSPKQSMEILDEKWSSFIPGKPLEAVFMNDQLDQFYKNELTRGKVLSSFSALSMLVSCLGLFGLAAFAMQQKRKEIGIRKVLGASVAGLLGTLSVSFIRLILIANFIAWPIAWYSAKNWLQGFAYHITPGLEIFAVATAATVAIAFLTISVQTIRAANVNPIETLREE
ncbi:MAG: FtsX-like permease family protein, partial [Cyclobacteriaceae bacterium]